MSTNEFKIAVLIPTRARTAALKLSIISLINRAINPDTIQIVIGFDDDDAEGLKFFAEDTQKWLEEKGVNYSILMFKRMGYVGLNRYYNTLAANTDSDWLMCWSDDAIMETTGWDTKITDNDGEFKLLKVHTHRDHPYSIFPIWPREWYNLFKWVSRHQMVDAELSQIAYMLDLIKIIDIHVTHDRVDLTGNNKDSTHKERVLLEGKPNDPKDFHHVTYNNARLADCDLIANYLKAQGTDISFWENVKAGTQDPWEKLKINDINHQMHQYQRA
jgi:hypothetical protein